jgi:hypothetical protein
MYMIDFRSHRFAQIPDEAVQYLLERSGCNLNDPKLSVRAPPHLSQ